MPIANTPVAFAIVLKQHSPDGAGFQFGLLTGHSRLLAHLWSGAQQTPLGFLACRARPSTAWTRRRSP